MTPDAIVYHDDVYDEDYDSKDLFGTVQYCGISKEVVEDRLLDQVQQKDHPVLGQWECGIARIDVPETELLQSRGRWIL